MKMYTRILYKYNISKSLTVFSFRLELKKMRKNCENCLFWFVYNIIQYNKM